MMKNKELKLDWYVPIETKGFFIDTKYFDDYPDEIIISSVEYEKGKDEIKLIMNRECRTIEFSHSYIPKNVSDTARQPLSLKIRTYPVFDKPEIYFVNKDGMYQERFRNIKNYINLNKYEELREKYSGEEK